MRITLKKQLDHLLQMFVIIFVISIGGWLIYLIKGVNLNFEVYLIPLFLVVFPTFIVHINYFLKNRKYDFEVLKSEIRVSVDGKNYEIRPEDTSKVVYVISPEMYENRYIWLPWNYYRHVEIYMKDGNKFVITSLLTNDFSWLFHLGFDSEARVNLYRLA